ncbi:hypothetical protein [Pseudomonas aeruginosa]|uniref:hypothetical protein n=1 Tax=Pseudomonas aeruginosa TaxID=287 RepID=UPI00177F1F6C|nr:hypothetical protein [Pseudomonas aeruginosa]
MASYYIEKSLKFLFFVLLTLMLSFPKSFAVIKIVILAFMFSMVFLHIVLGGVRRFSLDIIFFLSGVHFAGCNLVDRRASE